MIQGPNRNTNSGAGHHRAAGAKGDVAKHVEERAEHAQPGNRIGKIDQPIEHSIRPIPRLHRSAVLAGKALFERIDDRLHLRAQRSLDHDRVAGANRRQPPALRDRPRSRHSRPVCRGKASHRLRISGPQQYTRSIWLVLMASAGRDATRGRSAPIRAYRRAPRCAGHAGRPPPGRARSAPPPSTPDWRYSSRRSGPPRRSPPAACAGRRGPPPARSATATVPPARDRRRASDAAASTASEFIAMWRPGMPSL